MSARRPKAEIRGVGLRLFTSSGWACPCNGGLRHPVLYSLSMKTVTALVVYPTNVSFELSEDKEKSSEELQDYLWKQILKQADQILESTEVSPVILSCSEPGIVTHAVGIEPERPDTQADWSLLALQALQKTWQDLQPALAARGVLKPASLAERLTQMDRDLTQLLQDLVLAMSPRVETLEVENETRDV